MGMIKTQFKYTDEFGQETEVNKSYTEDVLGVTTSFELLVDDFKALLIANGFAEANISKLQIIEEDIKIGMLP